MRRRHQSHYCHHRQTPRHMRSRWRRGAGSQRHSAGTPGRATAGAWAGLSTPDSTCAMGSRPWHTGWYHRELSSGCAGSSETRPQSRAQDPCTDPTQPGAAHGSVAPSADPHTQHKAGFTAQAASQLPGVAAATTSALLGCGRGGFGRSSSGRRPERAGGCAIDGAEQVAMRMLVS